MPRLTKHGELRVRKRLGLPKRAVQRQAKKALAEGHKPHEFYGRFKNYLLASSDKYKTTPYVYNGNVYIFRDDLLISAWPVPARYKKASQHVR